MTRMKESESLLKLTLSDKGDDRCTIRVNEVIRILAQDKPRAQSILAA